MDQFFYISSQWRVAICIQCQHAVWPSNVAGHLKGARYRLPTKETLRIKRKVQETSVMQDPAEFAGIQALDEPIPELKVYHDASRIRNNGDEGRRSLSCGHDAFDWRLQYAAFQITSPFFLPQIEE